MKNLSTLCQQYLDGECTMDQFVQAICDEIDNMSPTAINTLATFIAGGEFE